MIIVLGKSDHLRSVINRIDSIKIELSWRALLLKKNQTKIKKLRNIRKIYVIGYDFSTFWTFFERCKLANIEAPIDTISEIAKNNPDMSIIYITTLATTKKQTYSRYLFCKQNLGYILSKFKNSYIIELNTIISENTEPIVSAGKLDKLIFSLLIKSGRISTCTLQEVEHKLRNYQSFASELHELTPRYLGIPRSQFLDRGLRYVLC